MSSSMDVYDQLRQLAGRIPCELCEIKGGTNIEHDGGCRHRPIVSGAEVSARVARRMNGIMFDLPVKRRLKYYENERAMIFVFLGLPYRRQHGLLNSLGENPNFYSGSDQEKFAICFRNIKNRGQVEALEAEIYKQEQFHKENIK
jgi:hypothetical protein